MERNRNGVHIMTNPPQQPTSKPFDKKAFIKAATKVEEIMTQQPSNELREKLATDQNKLSKCEHCGKMMIWLLRRSNVNSTMTDDNIRTKARNGLGEKMQQWCEHCNMFTLQTVVAFDLNPQPLDKEQK